MNGFLIQLLASIISLFIFWIFFTIFFRLIQNKKNKTQETEKKNKKEQWITICPKCGSIETERLFLSGKADKFWKAFNPVKYTCNKCKFEGIFPEAKVDMLEEIQKDIMKNKTVSEQKPKSSKNK